MKKISLYLNFDACFIIRFILIIRIIAQVTALLETLEFQESARRKGHFALYNCLVLGLQSISSQTLSQQSSLGYGHDQAAGYR